MNKRLIFTLILVVLGGVGFLLPQSATITKIGEWGTGNYVDVVVAGDYAYCAAGDSGLDIIDISNSSKPLKTANCETPGHASKVLIHEGYVYVADREGGLVIMDVSSPQAPAIVNTLDSLGSVNQLCIMGKYAFIGSYSDQIAILDIDRPTIPKPIAHLPRFNGAISDMEAADGFLYLSTVNHSAWDGATGLYIFDVSKPTEAKELVFFEIESKPLNGLALKGEYAYLDMGDRVQVLDVSTPTAPKFVGNCDIPGYHLNGSIFIKGNYAYAGSWNGNLHIMDVENPENPVRIGEMTFPDAIAGIYVAGKYGLLAVESKGLNIIDLTDPTAPVKAGTYDFSGYTDDVQVIDNHAYLMNGAEGLVILDVSDPAAPVKVGHYSLYANQTPRDAKGTHGYSSFGRYVFLEGNRAYVTTHEPKIRILDITNREKPVEKGVVEIGGLESHIKPFVRDGYIYLCNGIEGLWIVDAVEPANPVLSAVFGTEGTADVAYVSENYAYVSDWLKGLLILDVKTPWEPKMVGRLELGDFTEDIYVRRNIAYMAGSGNGLRIVEVTDPTLPVRSGRFKRPEYFYINHVTADDAYAYVLESNGFPANDVLTVLDVANPSQPAFKEDAAISAIGTSIFKNKNYIYVTTGDGGKLLIFQVNEGQAPPPPPPDAPTIALSRDSLFFAVARGEDKNINNSFIVENTGSGALHWRIAIDGDWLTCSPLSGTQATEIHVSVNPAGLEVGTYQGTITVTAPEADNSPQRVSVTLKVYPSHIIGGKPPRK